MFLFFAMKRLKEDERYITPGCWTLHDHFLSLKIQGKLYTFWGFHCIFHCYLVSQDTRLTKASACVSDESGITRLLKEQLSIHSGITSLKKRKEDLRLIANRIHQADHLRCDSQLLASDKDIVELNEKSNRMWDKFSFFLFLLKFYSSPYLNQFYIIQFNYI